MDKEMNLNRRYNQCTLKNTRKKITTDSDELATDYKLQQFLEDVQKFTERSKKTYKKKDLNRKSVDIPNQISSKRGLFENGLRSKPCFKGIVGLENRARLKGNLNDLVKECSQLEEDEVEMISSSDESSFEGSYELRNQEINNVIETEAQENEKAAKENCERLSTPEKQPGTNNYKFINRKISNKINLEEKDVEEMLCEKYWEHFVATKQVHNLDDVGRLNASEAQFEIHNQPKLNVKDRNQIKELLWKKYCRFMEDASSFVKAFPVVDHLKLAQQRINEMIYQTFLENARNYPSILKRIFSNDELKKLAQIALNDREDKCEQTDDLSDCGFPVNNCFLDGQSVKKDDLLLFTPSPKPSESSDNQRETISFFETNLPKKMNTQGNFLDALENQPDIFSPAVEQICSNSNATPPPSPLPADVQRCWAPSTNSSPRMPEILTPIITQPHSSSFFDGGTPFLAKKEHHVEIKQAKPNIALKRMQRKIAAQAQLKQSLVPDSPLELHFPKRKRVTFSPHRL